MSAKKTKKEKTKQTSRFIWDEVDQELHVLETCKLAVAGIEADWSLNRAHTPVSCTLWNSLDRLKDLLAEIRENSSLKP